MSPQILFQMQLVLGYVACLLCFSTYVLPRLKSMEPIQAHRVIATVHSFRFFGLVFILPGVVDNLPVGFATFAAYWDLATGVLAMLALLTVRIRPLFWLFVGAFNLVGMVDLIVDYYHAVQAGLPALAGQLGVAYAIPILYVPVLMITHVVAFYLLLRPQPKAVRALAGPPLLDQPPASLPQIVVHAPHGTRTATARSAMIDAMARSRVRLPPQVQPPYEVYISGVLQKEGADFRLDGRTLVFERELRKDKVSGWRWLLGAWGVGTYRQNDSVDIRYALDGRPMVAEGLDIEPDDR